MNGNFYLPMSTPPGYHPFREFLRTRDGQDFREGAVLTAGVAEVTQRLCRRHGFRELNIVRALVTALVSFVQAAVPADAWAETGAILADEIRARLTVEQD